MTAQVPIPEPDYDDPKEVYAFFGLTYYKASVLEQGVLNLAVALLARDAPGITVGHVDRIYGTFDRKTFGEIIKAAKARFQFPADLEADLAKALEQRNYLAHRYFVSHDLDFLEEEGRKAMIDELIEILKHLKTVDSRMDEIWMRAWEPLGITKEQIESKFDEYIESRQGRVA